MQNAVSTSWCVCILLVTQVATKPYSLKPIFTYGGYTNGWKTNQALYPYYSVLDYLYKFAQIANPLGEIKNLTRTYFDAFFMQLSLFLNYPRPHVLTDLRNEKPGYCLECLHRVNGLWENWITHDYHSQKLYFCHNGDYWQRFEKWIVWV